DTVDVRVTPSPVPDRGRNWFAEAAVMPSGPGRMSRRTVMASADAGSASRPAVTPTAVRIRLVPRPTSGRPGVTVPYRQNGGAWPDPPTSSRDTKATSSQMPVETGRDPDRRSAVEGQRPGRGRGEADRRLLARFDVLAHAEGVDGEVVERGAVVLQRQRHLLA